MNQLILEHLDDDKSDSQIRNILLEFQVSIDGQEYIKMILRCLQKRPVFESAPPALMYGRRYMADKNLFDSGIYALINEDAHSAI